MWNINWTNNPAAVKLENMFLGQSLVWQQVWKHLESVNGGVGSTSAPSLSPDASLQDSITALGHSLASIGDESNVGEHLTSADVFDPPRPAKRTKLGEERPPTLGSGPGSGWDASRPLPDDLVDSLVDVYFERVHPWIPMLHVQRFRQDLTHPAKRTSRSTILHAITSSCLRFSDDPRVAEVEVRKAISKRSRDLVILQSM